MEMLTGLFEGKDWFAIAGQIVLIATTVTGALPDKVVAGIPVLGKLWPILNWLAGNVFNNVNHPKGMKAIEDVEKEIDEAKAKVTKRVGISDTLDGV
tara:strand:+ start:143 stop:433 length:291 start_codon:yes stop_codon:yes gene_type:complete